MTGAKRKSRGWSVFIIALFILLCYFPYEFYSIYFFWFLPDNFLNSQAIFFALIAVLIILSRKKIVIPLKLIGIFILQFMGFALYNSHHDLNINSYLASLMVMALPVLLILWIDSSIGILEFYKKYNKWIMWMAILGVFTWILVTFFHYSPLFGLPDRADGRIINNYLFTFNKIDLVDSSNAFCYAGFFDERGAMGYWGMFALIFNKLFINNKRVEWLLMVCLLLTFSMGYYFQLLLYIALFYFIQQKTLNKVLMVLALCAIVLAADMTKGTDYNYIYENSIGRIVESFESSTKEKTIAVSSRATLTEAALEEFQRHPWRGTNKKTDLDLYTDNIYEPLVLYGIIGTPFVLFPFIWLLFHGLRYNRALFKCMIIILCGFFHRPFHQSLLYGFILYSLIYILLTYKHRIVNDTSKS